MPSTWRLAVASDGLIFVDTGIYDSLLDGNLLGHAFQRILALELLQLSGRVLLKERVDGQVTTADTDLDADSLDLDLDALRSELVDAAGLTHEHDLELVALWVVVDVLGELAVNGVILDRNVHSDALLEVDDVLLEGAHLNFGFLELLQDFEADLVRFVNFLFHLDNVRGSLLQLDLQVSAD